MLEKPVCPKCGSPLPVDELYSLGVVANGFLHWRTGLNCLSCNTLLRVTQWRYTLALWSVFGLYIFVAARLPRALTPIEAVGFVIPFLALIYGVVRLRKRLLGFRIAKPGQRVDLPLVDQRARGSNQRLRGVDELGKLLDKLRR